MYEALHDKVPGSMFARRLKFSLRPPPSSGARAGEEPGPGKGEVGGVV